MSWLQAVKAGDTVLRSQAFTGEVDVVVDRVTATQIVIGSVRFRRSDGYAIGARGWDRTRLIEPTPQALEAARRNRMVAALHAMTPRWKTLPTDVLEQIVTLTQL